MENVRATSWALPVLSVVSLLVIGGSVAYAEATNAKPHVTEAAADAEDASEADPAAGDPAAAASFQLCATGKYATYVVLPDDGNKKSATAQPGKCVTQALADEEEHSVKIYGLEGTTPFEVGEDEIGADGKVTAIGTIESPDYTVE
ncbi:hypothetical protein [Cryptosporangium arvum]|uniref:hypothetical protein n=1 Tax=Cryptosporangium arvum TaxID=80871 RepID=UPI0004B9FB89|nr:hypothetical protein [Cryptosporangium arvum]